TFGSGGVTMGDFGVGSSAVTNFDDLAVEPDGKIVVSGDAGDIGVSYEFLAAQLNPDGSFDKSFGTGGVFTHQYSTGSPGNVYSEGYSISSQPNNKLLITGYADSGTSSSQVVTVRLNPNGAPDHSFASGGVRLVSEGQSSPSGSYSDGYFIQAEPDGTAL